MQHKNKAVLGLALLGTALAPAAFAQNFQYSIIGLNGGSAPSAPFVVGQTTDSSVTSNTTDFTDNAGAPGQTFTAPTGASQYILLGLTLKGKGNSGFSNGGNPQDGNFNYRVSSVAGNALTPLSTYSANAAALAANNQFFTVQTNQIVNGGGQYAFDLYSDKGYFGLTSSANNAAYSGGTSYNLAGGSSRAFNSNTTAPNTNDRTFAAEFAVLNSSTITDSSTFTAVPSQTNVGQLDFSGNGGANSFSDNSPHPGQMFTTGSASSYSLQNLTVKGVGNSGRSPETANFFVRISKVNADGVTLAPLAIFTAPGTPLAGKPNSDYLTFNLTSAGLSLSGNTQYAYDIFTDGQAYYGFASGSGAAAAGQSALSVSGLHSFGLDNGFTADNTFSRTFNVGLLATPEPSQYASLGLGLLGLGGLALRARKRSLNS